MIRATQKMEQYSIKAFYAPNHPDIAKEYHRRHLQALEDFGVTGLSTALEYWWQQPLVYGLGLYNEKKEMVGGIRLEVAQPNTKLPLEAAIQKESPEIVQRIHAWDYQLAEVCGAWVAKSARKRGLAYILVRSILGVVQQLNLRYLLAMPPFHTKPIFDNFGFTPVQNLKNKSRYVYPDDRYISTLMELDNRQLLALPNISIDEQQKILQLRKHPIYSTTEEREDLRIIINYNLEFH